MGFTYTGTDPGSREVVACQVAPHGPLTAIRQARERLFSDFDSLVGLLIKLTVLWEYLCPTPETEGDLRNRLVHSIMADMERMAKQQTNPQAAG